MATIFDADNKIFALEIIDDKVTLNGSTIVYYFGDTPPTGDFSSKTLTKFDPNNHSIDIGSGNELSMPTKIMKDFLVDKSVTVSGVTIAPTLSAGGELNFFESSNPFWYTHTATDTGFVSIAAEIGDNSIWTSKPEVNYFVWQPKAHDIADLKSSIYEFDTLVKSIDGTSKITTAITDELAPTGTTKFKALIDSVATHQSKFGSIQGYYVMHKAASLGEGVYKLASDKFVTLDLVGASDFATLDLSYDDSGTTTAHEILEIGIIYGSSDVSALTTSLANLDNVDTSTDATAKGNLDAIVGNLQPFKNFYDGHYGPEDLNKILTDMGHDGTNPAAFNIVGSGIHAFEVDLDPDNSVGKVFEHTKFWDASGSKLIIDVKSGTAFDGDLKTIQGINNIEIINSTGAQVAIASTATADATQTLTLIGDFNTSNTGVNWSPTMTKYGTDSADTITGTTGAEIIYGLAGNDVIDGLGGNDQIYGGAGADKFVVDALDGGHVDIKDFNAGEGDNWEVTLKGGDVLKSATFNPANASDWSGGRPSTIGSNEWSIVAGKLEYNGGSVDGLGLTSPTYTPFEIVEVSGERYGDIITYGVKLKDSEVSRFSSDPFTSISMQIDWKDGEFEFFNYESGPSTPGATLVEGTEFGLGSTSLGLVNYDESNDYITIGAMDLAGFKYGADPTPAAADKYLAKIMLTRTATGTENDITLTKSNYSTMTSLLDVEKPNAKAFRFDYSQDEVTVKLENPKGIAASDPKLFVSSDTVTDGLSIIPVMKQGNLVKYEVVLNLSKPTAMKANKSVAPSQTLDIAHARIFDLSLVDKTDTHTSGTKDHTAVGGAVLSFADLDGNTISGQKTAAITGYDKHYFFDQLEAAADTSNTDLSMADLNTSRGIKISVTGLAEPTFTETELAAFEGGRYVLGEFTAIAYPDGIQYGSDATDPDSMIRMEARSVSADALTNGFKTKVNDGSDVVLLGETYYENPMSNKDAIGAEDALGALMIASSPAGFGNDQFIAADFDENGIVTAMDAYNIMRYAVYGEETDKDVPIFSYIDRLDGETITPATISFDNNIDLFIGEDTTIDATAVLKGDVSNSYETLSSSENPISKWVGDFNTKFDTQWNKTFDISTIEGDTAITDLINVSGTSIAADDRGAILTISKDNTSAVTVDGFHGINAIRITGNTTDYDATTLKTDVLGLNLQLGTTSHVDALADNDAVLLFYNVSDGVNGEASATGSADYGAIVFKSASGVSKGNDFATDTLLDVVELGTITFAGEFENYEAQFVA